ncbi:hypothetical protein D3C75_633480 [compost metagenome]
MHQSASFEGQVLQLGLSHWLDPSIVAIDTELFDYLLHLNLPVVVTVVTVISLVLDSYQG